MSPPNGRELLPPDLVESFLRCLAIYRIKNGDRTEQERFARDSNFMIGRPYGFKRVGPEPVPVDEFQLLWCPEGIMMGAWLPHINGEPRAPLMRWRDPLSANLETLTQPALVEFGVLQSNSGMLVFDNDLNQLGTIFIGLSQHAGSIGPWEIPPDPGPHIDGDTIFGGNYMDHVVFSFVPGAFQYYPEGRGAPSGWGY